MRDTRTLLLYLDIWTTHELHSITPKRGVPQRTDDIATLKSIRFSRTRLTRVATKLGCTGKTRRVQRNSPLK